MDLEFSLNRDVVFIKPKTHSDHRGGFTEIFVETWFRVNVLDVDFVQDNEVHNRACGTIRGLHFQAPPCSQGKLVRCSAGSIFDLTVDLRVGSPTFRRWAAVTLSAQNQRQVWIPPGFAHGLCTLEANTVVSYKVTSAYCGKHDQGIAWNDDGLNIDWPAQADPSTLSSKDRNLPDLCQLLAGSNELFAFQQNGGGLTCGY